jgi:serine/threonine protein kinase
LIPRGRTFKKDQTVLRDFERELANLKRLSHPHIIELVGSYTDPRFVGIIMSPVADCNLREFLDVSPLSMENLSLLRTFFGCLTAALCYLHENRIRHKDIKPQNVLVKGHQVFLTDFGISLDWTELGHSTTSGPTIRSPRYCAPEVADDSPRNSSSDIWSLGCIFLEMWTVLIGETVAALLAYLEKTDEQETRYYLNLSAVKSWCSTIGNRPASAPYVAPWTWIANTMRLEQQKRWTAQMLLDRIQEVNADEETKYTFSGLCCIENDESAESVYSPSESGEPLATNPLADETVKPFHPGLVEELEMPTVAKNTSPSAHSVPKPPEIPGMWTIARRKITRKGTVLDEDGDVIAKLSEGDLAEVKGKQVNADGEVLDQEGNVIGRVTLVHEGFGGLPELPEIPSLDILEGLKVNKKGDVLNEDGEVIASLSWGKLADVKGKMINEKGEVLDTEGKVIGKVELVPEAFGITQEQLEQARKTANDTIEDRPQVLRSAESAASVASQSVVSLESGNSADLPTILLTDRAKSLSKSLSLIDEFRKSQASQETIKLGKRVELPETNQEQPLLRPIAPKLSQTLERVRVRAKYYFAPEEPGELSVEPGEELKLLDNTPNDGWWMVRRVRDNSQGVVPATYIEIMGDDVSPPSTKVEALWSGRALYDFTAQTPDELTVKEGDILRILDDTKSDEWWMVLRLSNGFKGIVQPLTSRDLTVRREMNVSHLRYRRKERVSRSLHTFWMPTLIPETEPPPDKVRIWTDRTRSFQVEGALMAFRDSKINIHKVNGVKIAVPVEKLSAEDLEYVESLTGQRITPFSVKLARNFSS